MTKSHCLHIFKCQYLIEILRYGADFLHVNITFIGFKITFSNIRSHGAPLLIFKGWRLAPFPWGFDPQSDLGFKRVNSSLRYFLNQDFRDFLNRGLRISCTLQQLHFATHALCKPCTLQHVYFAHYNVHSTICIEPKYKSASFF